MTVIVGYAKFRATFHSFPIQTMQAITMGRLDEDKPLQNVFKRI